MPDKEKKIIVKVKKSTVADRGDYDNLRAMAKTGGGGTPKLASSGTPDRAVYDNLRASAVSGSNMGIDKTIDRATHEQYKAVRVKVKK